MNEPKLTAEAYSLNHMLKVALVGMTDRVQITILVGRTRGAVTSHVFVGEDRFALTRRGFPRDEVEELVALNFAVGVLEAAVIAANFGERLGPAQEALTVLMEADNAGLSDGDYDGIARTALYPWARTYKVDYEDNWGDGRVFGLSSKPRT